MKPFENPGKAKEGDAFKDLQSTSPVLSVARVGGSSAPQRVVVSPCEDSLPAFTLFNSSVFLLPKSF